jgi:hypothetical protein
MGSFSLWHWVILGAVAWLLWRLIRGMLPSRGPALVCTTCGHHGPATTHTRGSIWLELVLWLCFIVPGLIYSVWRLTSRGRACAKCGASTLVPADSPVGRKLLADQQAAPRA